MFRYKLRTLLIVLASLLCGAMGVGILSAGMWWKTTHPEMPLFVVGLASCAMMMGGFVGLVLAVASNQISRPHK
jgi:hypothetical protein